MKRAIAIAAFFALVLTGSAAAARISPPERAAINRTLDSFVNHAVKRRNVDAAWTLVTPELRSGISRSSWDAGNVPVIPYHARGDTFHEWTVDSATPTEVDFELMISEANSKDNSIQFYGTMRKLHGRWLVDSLNPSATFGGGAVASGSDYGPPPAAGQSSGVSRLGSVWIAIPAALFGAGILFLIGWFLVGWLRARRRRAQNVRPLDPLVVRKRDSEPALVAEERSQPDG